MKKYIAFALALAMLLTLTACKKKTEPAPESPAPVTPPAVEKEEPAETLPDLRPVEDVVVSPDVVEGRDPGGDYVLPEELTTMMDWQWQGAVGLVAQTEDVYFYAIEGKESCPALLRWGDSMAEFDWWYSTPHAIEPELWLMDIDEDGETEVVADCYGGSGTGASMEYIYIVEKDADGALVSHELPWRDLCEQVDKQLRLVSQSDTFYAVLGKELVDITEHLPTEPDAKAETLALGWIARYTPAEGGLNGIFGVLVEGEGIAGPVYVANAEGFLRYEDGVFTLTDLHLSGI